MLQQLSIDWDNVTHQRENNSFSEQILFDQYERLNNQCKKVYDLLKSGHRLTVKDAILYHGISSLPRRILDLKEKGVPIKDEMKNSYKEYFL
jgi:hypothetical protein